MRSPCVKAVSSVGAWRASPLPIPGSGMGPSIPGSGMGLSIPGSGTGSSPCCAIFSAFPRFSIFPLLGVKLLWWSCVALCGWGNRLIHDILYACSDT